MCIESGFSYSSDHSFKARMDVGNSAGEKDKYNLQSST